MVAVHVRGRRRKRSARVIFNLRPRKYNNNNNFAQIGHRCNLGGRRVYDETTYLLLLLLMILSTLAVLRVPSPHYHFADDEGRDLKYTTRSCSYTSESEPKPSYIFVCRWCTA